MTLSENRPTVPTPAILAQLQLREDDLKNAVRRHALPLLGVRGRTRMWSERDFLMLRLYLRLRGDIDPRAAAGVADQLAAFAVAEGAEIFVFEHRKTENEQETEHHHWWRAVRPSQTLQDIIDDYAWCHKSDPNLVPGKLTILMIGPDRKVFRKLVADQEPRKSRTGPVRELA